MMLMLLLVTKYIYLFKGTFTLLLFVEMHKVTTDKYF